MSDRSGDGPPGIPDGPGHVVPHRNTDCPNRRGRTLRPLGDAPDDPVVGAAR